MQAGDELGAWRMASPELRGCSCWSGFAGKGARAGRLRAISNGKDHLADFYLFALLHQNIFYRAAHRRWNFDHSFVGLEFHYRLTFGDGRPGAIISRTKSP